MENLEKTYAPKSFEASVYKAWEEEGCFTAKIDKEKKPFTIVMPPPNVTGALHVGHALNNTLQDVLIRWKRMQGYETLWVPGTDHASISTEAKVVEKIRSEGKSKEELGREKFLEEAWAWTRKYGGNIMEQLRKLGVSCDWTRLRFTLDEQLSEAVSEVFIRLYERGKIYRGDRIVNWCPSCATAISDAEVEHEDQHGHIWRIRYPFKDGTGSIEIETTRPETMLGDLAVAVNPSDERYRDFIGKTLVLPLVGREIPVIADEYVDSSFGSGAVKITPSHDPNDFEVGARHDLGQCVVIDEAAKIAEGYGRYSGMDRYEARKAILEDLKADGFLVQVKDHDNSVGHCERCGTVVEPLISKQWFVRMREMAEQALKEYTDGNLKFVPDRMGKIYQNWLENIRDWCISRQLWWGHRLPVYYCEDCSEVTASKHHPGKCSKCGSTHLRQDEDTLDTWFSSALWPFSTLGWPNETEDFKYFFPTDVLVTGYDIIFFWVVRMVFSSLEHTGRLPFKEVLLNGIVRDDQGRKMSKTLGNGIDPLEVIDNYGADALRFMLVTGNTPGSDMRFYMERVEASRNFANKLWNATRFVLMNLEDGVLESDLDLAKLQEEDRWILSKMNSVIADMTKNLEKYELGMAAAKIYDFIWSDFCDWYIEMVKSRLFGEDLEDKKTAERVLLLVLSNILKLLHPFMPFITEEIWSHLPARTTKLILASWPKVCPTLTFKDSERNIEYVQEAIKGIRNIRTEMNIPPSKKAKEIFVSADVNIQELIERSRRYFMNLSSADAVEVRTDKDGLTDDYVVVVLDRAEVYMPMKELIDFEKELDRLNKEKSDLEAEISRVDGKLSNEKFVAKAPEKVVQEERDKKAKYVDMLEKVNARIAMMKK